MKPGTPMKNLLRTLLACLLLPAAVHAKPIELVVPIAPGGSTDTLARVIAEELAKRLNEPVVVISKPGGGNTVAARYVLDEPADGRTLLLGTAVMAVVPHQKPPPFDFNQLVPVTGLYNTPSVLFVRASLPVSNIKEFLEWARKNPKGVSFGSTGVGSTTHIDAESLASVGQFNLVHVSYAGSGQTFTAMGGDHIDAAFGSPSMVAQATKQGNKVKPLMVGSDKPVPGVTDVPTVDKALLGDFRADNWGAVFVSAKTSTDVQQSLNAHINAVLNSQQVRDRFAAFMLQPMGGTRDAFEAFLRRDRSRIGQLLQTRNIVPR